MNWIVLVLVSTLVTAGHSILDKRLMSGQRVHPLTCAASFGLVGLPVGGMGVLLIPATPWREALLGILAGGIFVVAAWIYYDTVAREDISRVALLLRLSTAQMLVLEVVVFQVPLTVRQIAAFGALIAGGVLVSLTPNQGMPISRATLRLLPATTLLAIHGLLIAHVYRTTSLWAGVVWENAGMAIAAALAGGVIAWRGDWRRAAVNRRIWAVLMVQQFTRQLTGLAPAWAITHGVPVALLSALGGVRPVWVWMLAVLLLDEHVRRYDIVLKGGAVIGMALGVYWLA
jgi:drug/metabolite transporter (DMT)-like permease